MKRDALHPFAIIPISVRTKWLQPDGRFFLPRNIEMIPYFIEEIATKVNGDVPFYTFYLRGSGPRLTVYKINALDVDRLFLARFVERLQTPVAEKEFDNFLNQEQAEQEAHQRRLTELQVHITATKSLMEKLKRRLTLLTEKYQEEEEEDLVTEINRAYKGHKLELQRLQAEYETLVTSGTDTEKRRSFKKLMRDVGEAWDEVVTQQDIIELVELFVRKVSLEWVSPQFFRLTIYWKDNEWETDRAVCFKGGFPAPMWSEAETAMLKEHYATASGQELMNLLPLRTLPAMKRQACNTVSQSERYDSVVDPRLIRVLYDAITYHAHRETV